MVGGQYMRSILVFVITAVLVSACQSGPSNMDAPPPVGSSATVVNDISPKETLPKVEAAYSQFIDVRTPAEFAAEHATRARNIPLDTLPENLDMIEKNEPVYVICETGRRSQEAVDILSKNGFKYIFHVTGGMAAWRAAELPMAKPSPTP
jgi:rhodanese-related sulfurtransferase